MSASGGGKAIMAAFLANMGIAVAKFIAWFLSGSASMLAEAIHSVADSGNQLLLLLGGRQAKRRADREHPFGYGRERYVYAFVVSIILFSVGGLFSIYEGIDKLTHPHELENAWIPIAVRSDTDSRTMAITSTVSGTHTFSSSWGWVSFSTPS